MNKLRSGITALILVVLMLIFSACNLPQQGGSGEVIPIPTMNEEEKEWLGEEKPTPTPHTGKVGSGTIEISNLVSGLGSELDMHAMVPFTIYLNEEGTYQILGSTDKGTLRMDLEGTNCVCDGDYEVRSEINGSILGANTGECKIEFSETRSMGSGDCDCDCPSAQISCEDAFPDIEEFGPFTIEFNIDAQHYDSGLSNGLNYDYMWMIKELKFDSADCFIPDVIEKSP